MGSRQHGRSTQAVPYQQCRGTDLRLHEPGRGLEIFDVGAEVGVGKIAPALPQSGEVKGENRDSFFDQSAADPPDRLEILGASEAMGEQRRRPDRAHGSL